MSNTLELLTAEQVAKALGRHRDTILGWRRQGLIPAEIKRGPVVLFDMEKVRAALREDANQQ